MANPALEVLISALETRQQEAEAARQNGQLTITIELPVDLMTAIIHEIAERSPFDENELIAAYRQCGSLDQLLAALPIAHSAWAADILRLIKEVSGD